MLYTVLMFVYEFLPWWQLALVVFLFGMIIGSFLNVYIYRFHTGKSLLGSSHCLSCQTDLKWYELFPLLSYLFLRGRCRTCTARIPSRYFWVELATAVLFVMVVLVEPLWWLWLPMLFLVTVLVIITVYDIYHLIIPQSLVLAIWSVVLILIGYQWYIFFDWYTILNHVLAGLLAFLFFAGLWWYSDGRWLGLGDAKLAFPLGTLLGLVPTFSMMVLSFWVGTVIAFSLMFYQWQISTRGQMRLPFKSKPLTMKSEVPFAPFLIIGFITVWLFQVDVLQLISYVMPI